MNEDDLRIKILDERITQFEYLLEHNHFKDVDVTRIKNVIFQLRCVRSNVLNDSDYNHM